MSTTFVPRRQDGPETGGGAPTLCDRDLVVLSHLRWDWVWQRPQHLISRIGRGRRTWFVEQPVHAEVSAPRLRHVQADGVTRVWLEIPHTDPLPTWRAAPADVMAPLLFELLGPDACGNDVWLYDPVAVDLAERLQPRLFVYDAMDDLASFADAPPEMGMRVRRALTRADVVFAGGRSLFRAAAAARDGRNTHLF